MQGLQRYGGAAEALDPVKGTHDLERRRRLQRRRDDQPPLPLLLGPTTMLLDATVELSASGDAGCGGA